VTLAFWSFPSSAQGASPPWATTRAAPRPRQGLWPARDPGHRALVDRWRSASRRGKWAQCQRRVACWSLQLPEPQEPVMAARDTLPLATLDNRHRDNSARFVMPPGPPGIGGIAERRGAGPGPHLGLESLKLRAALATRSIRDCSRFDALDLGILGWGRMFLAPDQALLSWRGRTGPGRLRRQGSVRAAGRSNRAKYSRCGLGRGRRARTPWRRSSRSAGRRR
jgi:hypothetical protein